MADELNPFGPGPLDSHQVTSIEAQIEGRIAALPDDEAEKLLVGIEAAIKKKKSLSELKQTLGAIMTVVRPLIPIP